MRVKVECVSVCEGQGVTHKIFVSSGGDAKVKLCRELSRLALHKRDVTIPSRAVADMPINANTWTHIYRKYVQSITTNAYGLIEKYLRTKTRNKARPQPTS